jgi:hypothetical protein
MFVWKAQSPNLRLLLHTDLVYQLIERKWEVNSANLMHGVPACAYPRLATTLKSGRRWPERRRQPDRISTSDYVCFVLVICALQFLSTIPTEICIVWFFQTIIVGHGGNARRKICVSTITKTVPVQEEKHS